MLHYVTATVARYITSGSTLLLDDLAIEKNAFMKYNEMFVERSLNEQCNTVYVKVKNKALLISGTYLPEGLY